MNILVSIIVPIYKAEAYLPRCIDSILSQTYQDFELILVDDGSPDNCPKICDEYAEKDKKIRVIHKENGGVSSARNAGLDIMKGDYVTFIDADDYVSPAFLEKFMDEVSNHPDADLVISGHSEVFADRRVEWGVKEDVRLSLDEFKKDYGSFDEKIGLGYSYCKLYKARMLDGVRFDSSVRLFEDAIFNLSAYSFCKKIHLISSSDYFYDRTNENAATRHFSEEDIACAKKRYIAGKMFLCGKVEYRDDYFDQMACGYGVYFTHVVCDLKLPWKKRKALIQAMLEDDLYKMVAGCCHSPLLREKFLCSCCKHRHYQLLRFYWWLRRTIRGSK